MNPQAELEALTGLFPNEPPLIEEAEHVPSALTPDPYKKMLVHDQHMTVTMEAYHGASVDVKILDRSEDEAVYSREILLLKHGTDQVVQFGIVRFNMTYVTEAVRQDILEGRIPLGRILIEHNVLRHIDLGAILKIVPGKRLQEYFRCPPGQVIYGRLATIFCNKRPAVDLLEISAPLD